MAIVIKWNKRAISQLLKAINCLISLLRSLHSRHRNFSIIISAFQALHLLIPMA